MGCGVAIRQLATPYPYHSGQSAPISHEVLGFSVLAACGLRCGCGGRTATKEGCRRVTLAQAHAHTHACLYKVRDFTYGLGQAGGGSHRPLTKGPPAARAYVQLRPPPFSSSLRCLHFHHWELVPRSFCCPATSTKEPCITSFPPPTASTAQPPQTPPVAPVPWQPWPPATELAAAPFPSSNPQVQGEEWVRLNLLVTLMPSPHSILAFPRRILGHLAPNSA
nr:unnamed protein product [Digitaria exilis]